MHFYILELWPVHFLYTVDHENTTVSSSLSLTFATAVARIVNLLSEKFMQSNAGGVRTQFVGNQSWFHGL